jgi:carboxymethylenebutenolidase
MADSPSLNTLVLSTADGPMKLYEARPEGRARAGVVVIQEAFGVNEHIQDVTRRFAARGYWAVAPEIFHRAGGGTAPYTDFSKVLPLFRGLSDEAFLMDVDAACAHLANAGFGPERIGLVGFCMGGRVSFLTALHRQLGAAIGFYGGGIVTRRGPGFATLIEQASKLQTPWLGLFGDLDKGIPVEDVERLREALAPLRVATQIVRYADADHGFHCDDRAAYHAPSAADAWTRTLDWFDKHLAGR